MKVEVCGPNEFQGAIINQITKRNGLLVSTTENDNWFTIVAEVTYYCNIYNYFSVINKYLL